jgi:hypothetical protein
VAIRRWLTLLSVDAFLETHEAEYLFNGFGGIHVQFVPKRSEVKLDEMAALKRGGKKCASSKPRHEPSKEEVRGGGIKELRAVDESRQP